MARPLGFVHLLVFLFQLIFLASCGYTNSLETAGDIYETPPVTPPTTIVGSNLIIQTKDVDDMFVAQDRSFVVVTLKDNAENAGLKDWGFLLSKIERADLVEVSAIVADRLRITKRQEGQSSSTIEGYGYDTNGNFRLITNSYGLNSVLYHDAFVGSAGLVGSNPLLSCADEQPDIAQYNLNINAYLICTNTQLRNIESLSHNDNFFLGSDLNLELESEITPLFSEAGYSGTFNGQGFEIKNMKYSGGSTSVGLFDVLSGKVSNIGFVNPVISVSVAGDVGVLAGSITAQGEVENIWIKDGFVRSTSTATNVGGVTGLLQGELSRAFVENVSLSTAGYNIGAIAGRVDGVLRFSKAQPLEILGHSGAGSPTGGLVGLIGSSGRVESSYVHFNPNTMAIISGNQPVGGLVGRILDGAVLQNSYVSWDWENGFSPGGLWGSLVADIYAESLIINSYHNNELDSPYFQELNEELPVGFDDAIWIPQIETGPKLWWEP